PAVWRAHVRRARKDPGAVALADAGRQVMETVDNLPVGKPDVKPWTPAHSMGVREGNARSHLWREPGIRRARDFMALATPRRSTGINPRGRQPIDPRMPTLTPA